MFLVMLMGERYLWADTLCIVQDDPENKHRQINQMDVVYDMAWVTFVSLSSFSADEGLSGVEIKSDAALHERYIRRAIMKKSQSRNADSVGQQILKSLGLKHDTQKIDIMSEPPQLDDLLPFTPYEIRGWTFQERLLSPRLVYFSNW
jgi:hypothetical protein